MDPATPTVQLDDGTVRVTRWDFPPGTHTGEHVHQYDYVVIPLTGGVLTISMPDGEVVEAPLAIGASYARTAGVEHDVANLTDGVVSFVEIELLDRPLPGP
ncbi:MAG: cupin domain-containing protein [Actinomycetota bacterium]